MSRSPSSPIPPNPFLPGSVVSDLNNTRRSVNELSMLSGATNGGPSGQVNSIVAQRGPQGTSILDTAPNIQQPSFFGVLVDRGPSDGAANDFTDARYWVRQVSFNQTQGASSVDSVAAYLDASFLTPEGTYGGGLWAVATNLRESQTGTHNMPVISGTTSIATVLPSGACIVRVYQQTSLKFTNIDNDNANYIWVFEPVTANGNGSSVGHTMNVMTGLSVVGSNGTLSFQNVTVLATNATSSSTITLSGGTSRPYQGLLYSWHDNATESDILSLAYGASGSFSIIAPIPLVDNGSGGTYDPVLRTGNVFELTASGEYQFASAHTGNGLSLIVIIDDGVAVTYPSFFIGGAGLNQDMMSQPFAWALRASVTICDDLKVRIAGQLILAPLLNLPFTNPYFAPIVASSVGRTPDFAVPSGGDCRFRLGAAANSNGSDVVVYLNSMTLALLGPAP